MHASLLMLLLAGAPPPASLPLAQAPVVQAPSDAEIQNRVNAYLMTIDTPISADRWKALGDRAAPLLQDISNDEAKLPSRRAKAVEGLVAIAPANVTEHLTKLARNPQTAELVRWTAIRGLGSVVQPTQLVEILNPSLQDSDFRVRAVAAEVLSRHAPTQSCGSIRAKVAADAEHRAAFSKAITRCDGASSTR